MIFESKHETKRIIVLHVLIMLISSLAYNHNILRIRKKSLFSLNMSSSKIVYDSYVMKSLLSRIEENNIVDPGEWGVFVPFFMKGKPYGYLKNEFAEKLTEFNNLFDLQRGTTSTKKLFLRNEIDSLHLKEKSEAFSEMTKSLRNRGLIKGWRNELLPVVDNYSDEPVLLIERAAYPWFGIKGYGVHVNGYVTESTSSSVPSKLWVAKRSKTKSTWPSMLDHIVAGALPHNISPLENVVKECAEEANIPREIAVKAKPVGAVSYRGSDEFGCLKRDTLMCFDLKLPEDFIPTPVDGEVESFQLETISSIVEILVKGGPTGYKPNCNLVVIDFLIRHGIIPADAPYYLELVGKLRTAECS